MLTGGLKRVSVRRQEYSDSRLVKPQDDFWPWQRYVRRFGNPLSPKNRKRGHKVTRAHGHKGVVVPGDDGQGPWKLERAVGSKLAKDQEEDVGSTDGDEELADNKFHDLKKEEEAAYRAAAAGAMRDILALCALGDDESKQMDDDLKRKDRKKVAKRRAAKKKGDDEAGPQKKKRRAMFEEIEDPNSSDDESTESLAPQRRKRTAYSKSQPSSGGGTPLKPSGTPSGKPRAANGNGETPVKRERGEASPEEGSQDSDHGIVRQRRGRRPAECRAIEAEHWKKFQTADEKTIFSTRAATCKGVC